MTQNNTTRTPSNTPSNTERMAKELQELISSGMSMAEALGKVLPSHTAQTRRDTIAYIQESRNIPEVRRLKKIAYAKISKSKGKEEAIARYKAEIKAAEARLNELIKEVNEADTPWQKAMELGEDAGAAFNYFFTGYKEEVDRKLDEATKSMTRAQVKAELQGLSPKVPKDLPELLQEPMTKRIHNQDMQVITTCRKVMMLTKLIQK